MCLHPVFLPNVSYHTYDGLHMFRGIDVPCGKCAECLQNKQDEWFSRFVCEAAYQTKLKPNSCTIFFTLTYDNEHLPATREQSIKDIQQFRKKLNYHYEVKRYYFIQEFGDTHNRVHFHGLLFGIEDNIEQMRLKFIKVWNKGRTNAQIVRSAGAFRYVSKYTTKSINAYGGQPWKPYVSCSQRPALGTAFLTQSLKDVLNYNGSQCLRSRDQGALREPRSWRDRLRDPEHQFRRKIEMTKYALKKRPRSPLEIETAEKVFEQKLRAYHAKKRKSDRQFEQLQLFNPDEL